MSATAITLTAMSFDNTAPVPILSTTLRTFIQCITGTASNVDIGAWSGAAIAGVVPAVGDLVALMGQTAPEQSGVYQVVTGPALSRSGLADSSDELVNLEVAIFTDENSLYYRCTTSAPIVVDTTELTFASIASLSGGHVRNGATAITVS